MKSNNDEDLLKNVGEMMLAWRQANGKSVADVREYLRVNLGISRSDAWLNNFERRGMIDPLLAIKLADHFNWQVDRLALAKLGVARREQRRDGQLKAARLRLRQVKK